MVQFWYSFRTASTKCTWWLLGIIMNLTLLMLKIQFHSPKYKITN